MEHQESQYLESDYKIGEGSFGRVFKISFKAKAYALKIEKFPGSMRSEIETLKTLSHQHIPKLLAKGTIDGCEYIIIPIYKFSIHQIFYKEPSFFTAENVCIIGFSLVNILEYVHSMGYVYRDLKPENIMVGNDNKINLIDFGLCSKYIVDGSHISESKVSKFIGTPRYASLNTHRGIIQSRRDDLESLFYILLFLHAKSLPWSKCKDSEINKIYMIKEKTKFEQVCSLLEGGPSFLRFYGHIKSLSFKGNPNYSLLKQFLLTAAKESGNRSNKISGMKKIANNLCCCSWVC